MKGIFSILALGVVFALAAPPAVAQSYYNNGTSTSQGTQFTQSDPGVVVPQTGAVFGVGGTVAIAGTVPVSASTALPVAVSGTVPVSASTALPVAVSGTVPTSPSAPVVAPVDCSATLTTAGTPVQVISAGTTRQALTIQSAANAGVSFTTAAPSIGALGTYTLAPGATYQSPPGLAQSGAVWAVGSVAGQVLTCTYFK